MSSSDAIVPQSGLLSARLSHPCFPQPPDPKVKVWRYITLAKFVALLQANALNLSRLDQMADPYEGTTTRRTAAGIDAYLKRLGSERGFHEVADAYRKTRASMFVSCWHANEHESEAMWRLYCGTGGGVAIQTTYARLVESVADQHDVYVGLVQYVDYEDASFPDANAFYPVMHKRASFAHEREVRLVRYFGDPPYPDTVPMNLALPWEVDAFCENVFVDPYAPAYYFESVKAVLEAMRPTLLPRLHWSRMKADPFI